MKFLKTYEQLNSTEMYVSNNNLTSLSELPNKLKVLDCHSNLITSLPTLPDTLRELYCNTNKLTTLPKLPTNLRFLDCSNNKFTDLPELPDTIESLYIDENLLTKLPKLPKSLEYFNCRENPFDEPLPKEIISEFELEFEDLYTIDRLVVFKSEEWQRQFLTEKGNRFKDIEEWVLPQIKEEFDYIYDSAELGLL